MKYVLTNAVILDGAEPSEEIIKAFKEREACHITAISPALPYALTNMIAEEVTE